MNRGRKEYLRAILAEVVDIEADQFANSMAVGPADRLASPFDLRQRLLGVMYD